jgi:hypothetical protein
LEITFADYVNHGWKLCRIEPGTKGPRSHNWNELFCAVVDPDAAAVLPGAGLMHAYSGTCALDIDDLEKTREFFKEHGLTLKGIEPVQIDSGRPNRSKYLFKLDTPLPTKSWGCFELRCGTNGGKTAQDVLPPSIHPVTNEPYKWIGDWQHLPALPENLLNFWKAALVIHEKPVVHSSSEHSPQKATSFREIADLLSRRDPSCGYDEWIKIGMAVHHGTGGSDDGLAIWDEWSAPSDKYPGLAALRSHWVSFGRSANPVTVDSLRRTDVADVQEFEAFTESEHNWLTAIEEPKADENPFLSLQDLFKRPKPTWLIPGVLPKAQLGAIWGQSQGGKTFLAVDMALSIANGTPWRGLPVVKGEVLYIAAEDDSGVQLRLEAGLAARGVQDAAIRVMPMSVNLTDPERMKWLYGWLTRNGNPSVIFFDTLAAVTPGADENTTKDMGKLIDYCKKVSRATGALVILIHHAGKTEGKGMRGSSILTGAMDFSWEVTDEEHNRILHVTKLKNAPTGNKYPFRLLPMGETCIVEWL